MAQINFGANITATMIGGNIKKIGNYVLKRELGSGQFGTVFEAFDETTKQVYAVKRIEKKKMQSYGSKILELLKSEISIMQKINHPNILHLYDYIESNAYFYLVLNFCKDGDMEHYMSERGLKYFEEKEAVMLLKQIMNGFSELRKRKILHRDFKLANIFMSDGTLVIGDFGLAREGAEQVNTIAGTPMTMAPELLLIDMTEGGGVYDSKADIWSIGVVYYQLLFSDPPYTGYNKMEIYRAMKERTGDKLLFPRNVSEESKNLLRKTLTMDPKQRIGWAELFSHPLFSKPEFQTVNKTIIGPSGQDQVDLDANFTLNKGLANAVDNVQFNIPQSQELAQVNFKKDNEKTIDPNLEKQILLEMGLKEIGFRYNHERNKILFHIFSVKHLQWALTKPKFAMYADPLFQISLLILKKALVLNNGITYNLNSKENIFKINRDFWQAFISSPYMSETKNLFMSVSAPIQEYLDLVKWRTKDNGFNADLYKRYLDAPNPNLVEVDKELVSQRNRVKALKENDVAAMSDPVFVSNIECLDKLISTCIMCEAKMEYMTNVEGHLTKFKMDDYYKRITEGQGVPFY